MAILADALGCHIQRQVPDPPPYAAHLDQVFVQAERQVKQELTTPTLPP
jgi:hypothetical protein